MIQSRRQFLQASLALACSLQLPLTSAEAKQLLDSRQWWMPDEAETHLRSWMSFIASRSIWCEKLIPEVLENLALIATTIAQYEPVSILVRQQDRAIAIQLLGGLDTHKHPIELIDYTMDDLWMRDTGPIFIVNQHKEKAAIDFNFNGWGKDQAYQQDVKIASFVAQQAGVARIVSSLTLEGGCFEVDGQGSAIMTESCILNNNRNPNISKPAVEAELKQALGLDTIIWLKGIKGRDITDGHTDFYARFARPGVVVVNRDTDADSYDYAVTRENIEIIQSSIDAQGNKLEQVIIDTPRQINQRFDNKNFAASYVGYYLCNGAVIMQKFDDKQADAIAKEQLTKTFPHHTIEQIAVNGIASGGGSIHCATQQEPLV